MVSTKVPDLLGSQTASAPRGRQPLDSPKVTCGLLEVKVTGPVAVTPATGFTITVSRVLVPATSGPVAPALSEAMPVATVSGVSILIGPTSTVTVPGSTLVVGSTASTKPRVTLAPGSIEARVQSPSPGHRAAPSAVIL